MQKQCKTPQRVACLLNQFPVDEKTQEENSWNPNDKSLNFIIEPDDPFTIHRRPVQLSTDCVRGRRGYTSGIHAFEVTWDTGKRGTHAVIGVAKISAPIHAPGYSCVVGSTADSWGWNITKNRLFHNNNDGGDYPFKYKPAVDGKDDVKDNFTVPKVFKMVLDMDEGTLAFVVENQYLGVAFYELKGKTLYPIVNVVYGHAKVTCKYLGNIAPGPPLLQQLCRLTIREQISCEQMGHEKLIKNVRSFCLPLIIQNFLL